MITFSTTLTFLLSITFDIISTSIYFYSCNCILKKFFKSNDQYLFLNNNELET